MAELIDLLHLVAIRFDVENTHVSDRDFKDSFLLDFIESSSADYLATGDKDLLEKKIFKTTAIVIPKEFERMPESPN